MRYSFGARLLLPLACGAAHVRPDVFLIGTLVSSIVLVDALRDARPLVRHSALAAIGRVRRYDQYAIGVVVGLAVVAWLMIRRRRRARALALALATPRKPLAGA